jgi:sulfite exporter TauE/SafE
MLYSAIILGLLGSVHCVGMCGPIAFIIPVDHSNSLRRILQVSLYHLGRIITYGIIGLIFGLLGKGFYLFGIQQQLSITIGAIMILLVTIPYRIFNKHKITTPITRIISKIKNALGKELKKKTPDTFLTIGFLNGFLPCGLVYMAVFGALASGTALHGSLYMVYFGLGTIPLMTIAIYMGNFLKGKIKQYINRSIPIVIIIIGVLFILRGMGLGIPYLSPIQETIKIEANSNCIP